MRKFKCSGLHPDTIVTLKGAMDYVSESGDTDRLADLAIGDTFIDDDGDTWERVE